MKILFDAEKLSEFKSREKLPLECTACSCVFYKPKNEIMRGIKGTKKLDFCSRQCVSNQKSKMHRAICKCNQCGEEFSRELSAVNDKNFCSSQCAAKFNNNRLGTGSVCQSKNCLVCKIDIGFSKKTFCSHSCYYKFKYDNFITKWKTGEVDGSSKSGCSSTIRKYLFKKYNNACSECGWNKINLATGKSPLEIDHIDGDHKNNIESNLRLLCPNCHSLTPTYKSLNKGNGRKYRK